MKDSKIVQKVYYSISNYEATPAFINNILEPARKANSKINVTGCLLFHKNIFLQLLEGEKEVVENLFDRIAKDKRHKEVTLIFEENVNKRIFPNWSMAYYAFDKNEEEIDKFVNSIKFFSENNDKPTEAIEIFWNMAKHIVN